MSSSPRLPRTRHAAGTAVNAVAVFVVFAVVILGVSVAAGRTHLARPATGATPSTSAPARPTAGQVQTWYDRGGADLIRRLAVSGGTLARDADYGEHAAELQDGRDLDTLVAEAERYPPMPDGQAQESWSSAIAYYAGGAQAISEGRWADGVNATGMAANEVTRATVRLGTVKALGG